MPDFEFYLSESAIRTTPKEKYIDDFEEMYDDFADNAPNYYPSTATDAVEEELIVGTKTFTKISARVDSFVDPSTGKNIGDDYKMFIFSPSQPKQFLGKLYKWKNNYWMAVDVNSYESLSNGCLVRRCNNVLRWVDRNGIVRTEPCIMSYELLYTRNNPGRDNILTSGEIFSFCQKNDDTNYIFPNMRFLFGTPQNRTAYKISGSGVQNFLNRETENESGVGVLQIKMNADYVNSETDNVELGIADAYINYYQILINQDAVYGSIGLTAQMTANVYKDGSLINTTVIWESSDDDIFTVDSNGLITFTGVGHGSISASLGENLSVKDERSIFVTSTITEDYDVRISPDICNIYEGTTETFTCELFLNEVVQPDTFTFEILGNVPTTHYVFTEIDGNTFSVKNIKMYLDYKYIDETAVLYGSEESMKVLCSDRQSDIVLTEEEIAQSSNLIVRCVSGIHQRDFSFRLKGVF